MTAQHQEQKIDCRLLTLRGHSYDFAAQIYDGSGAQPVQHLKGVIVLGTADPVDQLQQRNQSHLVGIGGVSMSPLAEVLHGAGVRITGSDAHYLDQVWEAEHAMELPERTAAAVLYWLQGTR